LIANANSACLASNANIANVDIEIARRKIVTRARTYRDVSASGSVGVKGKSADSGSVAK
jgi:hypothetical protein